MFDITKLISDLREIGYNGEPLLNTIDYLSDKRNFIDDDGLFDNKIGDQLDNLIAAVDRYKNDPTEDNKDSIDANLEYFRELTQNPERLHNLKPIDEHFVEEGEEPETPSISNINHSQSEGLAYASHKMDNNIFLDNKTNINSDSGEFEQSALFEDDVNPYEEIQPEVSDLNLEELLELACWEYCAEVFNCECWVDKSSEDILVLRLDPFKLLSAPFELNDWKDIFDAFGEISCIGEASDNILIINGMIASNNAQTNKSCSKCEAVRRKYKYCLFQIDRMREELREQQEIEQQYVEQLEENKYDIKEFLQKNYPSIDRFLLKDVQTKYKSAFKINLTFDELKKKIEETGLFTISNVHRTMYVNKK